MKKIAIIGGKGMLASQCIKQFLNRDNYSITVFTRDKALTVNAYKNDKLLVYPLDCFTGDRFYCEDEYDFVVNCAGVIKPFIKNETPKEVVVAVAGNVLLPEALARFLDIHKNAKAIQIATDCVYSGEGGGYFETDPHDARDVYGKTKSLGEMKRDRFYNIRCSIIGEEILGAKNSLVEWVKNQPEKQTIPGYQNHLWNGVTTKQFALICMNIIDNDIQLPNIQHVVPAGPVSKMALLSLLSKKFRPDLTVSPSYAAQPVDRTLSTINKDINLRLWSGRPKTIEEMISEM